MKDYISPKIEIIKFLTEDVIMGSVEPEPEVPPKTDDGQWHFI